MDSLIWLVIGIGGGYLWGKKVAMEAEPRGDRVMSLFRLKDAISNEDVEVVLGVSDATATRILDELEKSGQVVQEGSTGAGVVYRKK